MVPPPIQPAGLWIQGWHHRRISRYDCHYENIYVFVVEYMCDDIWSRWSYYKWLDLIWYNHVKLKLIRISCNMYQYVCTYEKNMSTFIIIYDCTICTWLTIIKGNLVGKLLSYTRMSRSSSVIMSATESARAVLMWEQCRKYITVPKPWIHGWRHPWAWNHVFFLVM